MGPAGPEAVPPKIELDDMAGAVNDPGRGEGDRETEAIKRRLHDLEDRVRSARGRIITTAFHFDLGDERLPEVEGRDDAARARWVPIGELPQLEEQLFEDHACILDHFLGLWPTPSAR